MAEAKSIKLIYFDLNGRGEIIRLLLHYSGREFEDIRLPKDQWPEIKPTTPFGQVPVLEIDGKRYGQSVALATHLAREFGLYGQSNLDALTIDMVYQLFFDLMNGYIEFYRETDPDKKEEILKKLKTELGPRYLGHFEKLLAESGTGYFVGSSITLADIVLFDIATGFLNSIMEDSIDDFPLVQKLVETVGDQERIKQYTSERN